MQECSGYKDSGAAWIGKIPCTWDVHRLKIHLKRVEEKNPGDMQVLSLYRELGIVPKDSRDDNHNVTSEDTSKYKYVKVGDFVVNKMKAWQGSVAVSDYEGIVSPAYYVYKFTDSNFYGRYFHYLLRSCYREEFMRLSEGIRIGQWDLSSGDLDNVPVLLPPMQEQKAIALYLDNTTKSIDDLISEAKASIEEYKSWKASIIYEAVTKGLDPQVEMKDSGVEWIGKIPSHWKRTKLANCFRVIGSGTTPTSDDDTYYDGTINWVQSGDINGGIVTSTKRHISDIAYSQFSALKIYEAPFIAVAMYGASIANTSIVEIPACTNQACCVLCNASDFVDMTYIFFALLGAKEELLLSARGGTQPNINQDILKKLRIPIPKKAEQERIVHFLKSRCKKIDILIKEKETLITDLEAYKKSMIFEVVTGKRRVI